MPLITSVGDLITFALRTSGINGVGQTPLAEDSNTGLQLLYNVMAEWQRKRWLVPSLVDMAITATGAQSYTIGPIRPTHLHAAYVRLAGGIDVGLTIIPSREDYAAISLKSLASFPIAAFLDTAWPTGRVYIWPIPSAAYELHFVFPEALPVYSALTDPVNLPPEYQSALLYSLAYELALNYGLDPRPSLVARMRGALATLRSTNTQPSTLDMPAGVTTVRRGGVSAGNSPAFQSGLF